MRRLVAAVLVLPLLPLVAACGDDTESYCDAVRDHQEELGRIVGEGGPDALLRALGTFRDLQGKAPSDISDEWQQVVDSVAELARELDQAGVDASSYDPATPPAGLTAAEKKRIADAATEVGSAETVAALQDLDQQARDVCHTPLSL